MDDARRTDRGDQMVHDGPVAVAVVSSRMAAELIVGFLRSNDVPALVVADDAGGQEPQLQLEGVRVLVAPADAALARELLAERGTPRTAGGGA
ncbi:MAG: hypothetical protein AVDCRST_MAG66-1990 [uncultured Pseudonocardia sp.]|uniref:DUF2007 domain-containing protein n=1 Tax=uncultured Pseudonocardia sp. TaxID=211455 RepID=A0A6J4PA07_9PSEU|nr:MAG: hypothetical protein AVDCRST_MAG66-1990 [uncultured Pseudonocardia sp.]